MIIVTGAAGFIGSCVTQWYARNSHEEVVAVDHFSEDKSRNLEGFSGQRIEREEFFEWAKSQKNVRLVIHLGARTDTTEFDKSIFDRLNVEYSKKMWNWCAKQSIPLIYASSAATYGFGEYGYKDDHAIVDSLKPLNPYGDSKNEFDQWALAQVEQPPHWFGLKFFNVYGPNEYHKGRMASVIFHAFRQINETGGVKLFRSHNPDFKDGEQLRDFVYVKDLVSVIHFLADQQPANGLYNLGSGKARTFKDLAQGVFKTLGVQENINYIDTPEDIRDKYQYFTEADMNKLISAGYAAEFTSLENGVEDYVRNYLVPDNSY